MILQHLHPLLTINYDGLKNMGRDLNHLSVSEGAIGKLRETYAHIPDDYLDIINYIDGVTVIYRESGWVKFAPTILSALEVVDYTTAWYPFLSRHLKNCFFFAQEDDNSYFLGDHDGRYGVYRVETSVADWENAEFLAPSIKALLCDGVGWAPQA